MRLLPHGGGKAERDSSWRAASPTKTGKGNGKVYGRAWRSTDGGTRSISGSFGNYERVNLAEWLDFRRILAENSEIDMDSIDGSIVRNGSPGVNRGPAEDRLDKSSRAFPFLAGIVYFRARTNVASSRRACYSVTSRKNSCRAHLPGLRVLIP